MYLILNSRKSIIFHWILAAMHLSPILISGDTVTHNIFRKEISRELDCVYLYNNEYNYLKDPIPLPTCKDYCKLFDNYECNDFDLDNVFPSPLTVGKLDDLPTDGQNILKMLDSTLDYMEKYKKSLLSFNIKNPKNTHVVSESGDRSIVTGLGFGESLLLYIKKAAGFIIITVLMISPVIWLFIQQHHQATHSQPSFSPEEEYESEPLLYNYEMRIHLARLCLPEGKLPTSTEVNVAYKQMARQQHPDKNPVEEKEKQTEIMKRINEAKDFLLSKCVDESP